MLFHCTIDCRITTVLGGAPLGCMRRSLTDYVNEGWMTKHVLSTRQRTGVSRGILDGTRNRKFRVADKCYRVIHTLIIYTRALFSFLFTFYTRSFVFCSYLFPGPWPLLIDPEDVNQVCTPSPLPTRPISR